MGEEALVFEGVTKRYGSFVAVDGLSFSAPTGSVLGFLGPNGAGKTTSIRMALDIMPVTSGEIRILGSNQPRRVRARVGYLPEEKGLYRNLRAWEAIAYLATLKGLSGATARGRAFELLEWAGLGKFARTKISALSKGMGQKVQVLAAIAHEPELAILDEPFSGLDPVNQQAMESVVMDFKNKGRTVIFSTHVMAHAERMCDRVVILARGRKRFEGTPAEARRLLPLRVRLAGAGAFEGLKDLPAVARMTPAGDDQWVLDLAAGGDAQPILEACFTRQLRLRRFTVDEPTLHDVFVSLVGADQVEERQLQPQATHKN